MQTNIKMYIFLSSFVVTLCTVTDAWLTKYDFNGDYGDHKWNSQVSPPCIKANEECFYTSQCCSRNDVCVMDSKLSLYAGRKIGLCRDLEYIRGDIQPTKFEGEACEDSSDCIDGCCISIRRHRYGVLQVCARENGPFMCITSYRQFADGLSKK
ncbi:uncharacterized protein [Mytilus edulis]|uniref:uncharacterized protein isoform X1 n=1 Tax=Mytilus edulis TaxID=6550 RepID=UPI0039F0CD95